MSAEAALILGLFLGGGFAFGCALIAHVIDGVRSAWIDAKRHERDLERERIALRRKGYDA